MAALAAVIVGIVAFVLGEWRYGLLSLVLAVVIFLAEGMTRDNWEQRGYRSGMSILLAATAIGVAALRAGEWVVAIPAALAAVAALAIGSASGMAKVSCIITAVLVALLILAPAKVLVVVVAAALAIPLALYAATSKDSSGSGCFPIVGVIVIIIGAAYVWFKIEEKQLDKNVDRYGAEVFDLCKTPEDLPEVGSVIPEGRVLFVERGLGNRGRLLDNYTSKLPKSYRAHNQEETAEVVCIDRGQEVFGSGTYTNGAVCTRYQQYTEAYLVNVATGSLIANQRFYGSTPPGCPSSTTQTSLSRTGNNPSSGAVADWVLNQLEHAEETVADPSVSAPVETSPDEQSVSVVSVPDPESSADVSITAENAEQVVELAVAGSGEIFSVTWNPDKTGFAAASTRGVWLFDGAGQNGRLLTGHTDEVLGVVYSPDGATLASWGKDETIRLWDAMTGAERTVLQGHTSTVYSAVFSGDGSMLVSGSSDETVRLWNVATGEAVSVFEGCHDAIISSVAYSPDYAFVASGGRDNRICLWDVAKRQLNRVLEGATETTVEAVTFSPDGTRLASASYDGTIQLWDTVTGETITTFQGGMAHRVAFSADGSMVAAEGEYDQAFIWDVATGEQLYQAWEKSSVLAVPPANGSILVGIVSEQPDHTLIVQDALTNETVVTLAFPNKVIGTPYNLSYSPDGTMLASDDYPMVNVWDGTTGDLVLTLKSGDSDVVAFTPDGTALASYARVYRAFTLWEMPSGTVIVSRADQQVNEWSSGSEVFSPDLALVAVSQENDIEVWNVAEGTLLYTLRHHTGLVQRLIFSPDGKLLASGGEDESVCVWDVATGTLLNVLEGHMNTVLSAAFSPDSTVLATGDDDGMIQVWNLVSGTPIQTWQAESSSVQSLAFNPDNTLLASGQRDGTIRLWNIASGETAATLTGHRGTVASLRFSPDGSVLASGSRDNTLRLWGIS